MLKQQNKQVIVNYIVITSDVEILVQLAFQCVFFAGFLTAYSCYEFYFLRHDDALRG